MKTVVLLLLTTLILSCGGTSDDGSDGGTSDDGSDSNSSESEETDFTGTYSIKDSNCITTTQSFTISQNGDSVTMVTDDNETLEGDIVSVNGYTGFAFYSVEDYDCVGAFIDSDDLEWLEDEGIDSDVGDLGIFCYVDDTECIGSFD